VFRSLGQDVPLIAAFLGFKTAQCAACDFGPAFLIGSSELSK